MGNSRVGINRRRVANYVFTLAIIVLYGGQVCPYVEGLGFWTFAAETLAAFGVAWLAFFFGVRAFERSPASNPAQRQFRREIFLLLGAGLITGVWNYFAYRFPAGSGIKILVGWLALGFFVAADLSLKRAWLDFNPERREGGAGGGQSLARKFTAFAVTVVLLLAVVISLIVIKDLSWLTTVPADELRQASLLVAGEIFFVLAVLLALIINLIVSYARNLRQILDAQQSVLAGVSAGHLDSYVPVVSGDELGVIARHTNRMIDGLREKRRIQAVFGKIISPEIAKRLMATAGEDGLPAGDRKNLTIWFSDLRNFTAMTESLPAAEVVSRLNHYFRLAVDIIHRHGGEVDKFIGDGLLAVFGLKDEENAPQRAVEAAAALLHALNANGEFGDLRAGIGLNHGEVIAGGIGSPERLEYTFIGDTVNVAARLEAANKEAGTSLMVSREVYDRLTPATRAWPWRDLGEMALRGRRAPVAVFGLEKGNA